MQIATVIDRGRKCPGEVLNDRNGEEGSKVD